MTKDNPKPPAGLHNVCSGTLYDTCASAEILVVLLRRALRTHQVHSSTRLITEVRRTPPLKKTGVLREPTSLSHENKHTQQVRTKVHVLIVLPDSSSMWSHASPCHSQKRKHNHRK